MADRVSTTKLNVETDKSGVADTNKALSGIEAKLRAAEIAAIQFNLKGGALGITLAEINKIERANNIDELAKNYAAASKSASDLAVELERIGATEGEIKAAANAFSQAQSAKPQGGGNVLGRLSQSAGAVGALASQVSPEAGQFLQLGQQISNAAKELPNLVQGLTGIGNAGAVIAPAAGAASTGLAGIGTAIAGLATTILPVAVVVGGLALALKSIGDQAAEAVAQLDKQIEASKARIATEREVTDFLTAGDKEGAKARLDKLKAQQEDDNKLLTELYVAKDNADKAYAALGAALNPGKRKELADVAAEAQKQIDALTPAFQARAKEQAALEAAIPSINEAAAAKEKEAAVTKDLAQSEEDLASQRQSSQDKINALNAQNARAQSDYAEATSNVNAARRVRDQREEQDYQEARSKALTQHNAKLADIAAQGAAKIEQINSQLAAIPAERQGKIVEAESKYNADVAKINADYMKSELAAVRKFAADEAKINQQNAKNRLRELQDLGDNLADAELSNDVVRFIQTKREGEKRLAREAQDADQAAQERAAQFAADRAAADQARQERLAAAAEALAQEKADIDAAAAQKRAQLQQQIVEEQAAIQQRVAAEIAGFQKSEQEANAAREKRLARQKEDDGIADAARKRQLDKQLADIVQKTNAETAALNTILAKVNQIGTAANAIRTTFSSSSSSSSSGSRSFVANNSGSSTRRGSGIFLSAFAEGGIVPKGTSGFGFFEGKQSEAVIPLDKFNPGGQAGGSINLSVNVNGLNVGKIVSAEEVTATARQLAQQAGHEVLELIAKANVNARFKS